MIKTCQRFVIGVCCYTHPCTDTAGIEITLCTAVRCNTVAI